MREIVIILTGMIDTDISVAKLPVVVDSAFIVVDCSKKLIKIIYWRNTIGEILKKNTQKTKKKFSHSTHTKSKIEMFV